MALFFSASPGTRPDLILSAADAARQDAARREQARIAGHLAARVLGAKPFLLAQPRELPTHRRRGR